MMTFLKCFKCIIFLYWVKVFLVNDLSILVGWEDYDVVDQVYYYWNTKNNTLTYDDNGAKSCVYECSNYFISWTAMSDNTTLFSDTGPITVVYKNDLIYRIGYGTPSFLLGVQFTCALLSYFLSRFIDWADYDEVDGKELAKPLLLHV